MPVLYINSDKHDCLKREPYVTLLKKFEVIKDSLDAEEIELRVGGRDGCFANGFYTDDVYYKNPRLKISFATVPSPDDRTLKSFFIRAAYSFESEDDYDLEFHLQRIKDIKKRVPYFYLPDVTHFEFSSQIDEDYKLFFDAVVDDREKVRNVCCMLISLIISVFSLDN